MAVPASLTSSAIYRAQREGALQRLVMLVRDAGPAVAAGKVDRLPEGPTSYSTILSKFS